MSYLVLGGTRDALELTRYLIEENVPVIYSLAGKVRVPELACSVITGGFSSSGGMAKYIVDNGITAIIDVTHPYAAQISANAAQAGREANVPYWQYRRPEWISESGDDWHHFESWPELMSLIEDKQSTLFAIGQIPEQVAEFMAIQMADRQSEFVVRSAVESLVHLPDNVKQVKAIGPFKQADEEALMKQFGIDAMVCKNSGGEPMFSKMKAARALGIPVFILKRPALAEADKSFSDLSDFQRDIVSHHLDNA